MVNASAPDFPRVRQYLRASFPNLETLPTKPSPQVRLSDRFGLSYYLQRCEKMEGPICQSRFLNLTASGRAFRCGSAPNCDQLKPLQDYGWKKRNDICPGQQVWFKQGWCNRCLQALVKSVEVS